MQVITVGEGLKGVSISADVLNSQVADADRLHGEQIRNDSARQSAGFISASRAQIRNFVDDTAALYNRNTNKGEVSSERKKQIMSHMAMGLGFVQQGSQYGIPSFRGDSYFYSGQLVDTSGGIVRLESRRRPASELLTVRNFDPGKEIIKTRAMAPSGSVGLYSAGTTVIPEADFGVVDQNSQAYWLVCKTSIDWVHLLYGSRSDFDIAAEKAKQANDLLLDAMENIRFYGFTGTDLKAFKDLNLPTYNSNVDFTPGGTIDIESAFSEFVTGLNYLDSLNDDRGGLGQTLLIGTDLIRAIMPLNNIGAGGSMTGFDVFGKMGMQETMIGGLFRNMGISRIIRTPKLNNWGGDPTRSAAVLFDAQAGEAGIRQLIGMAPAPVRAASTLTHDEQLWAARVGPLEAPTTSGSGIFTAKVK